MRGKTRCIFHDGDENLRPFVYFVVQKVACTSVKTALAPLFGMDPSVIKEERREGEGPRFLVHQAFNKSKNQIELAEFIRRSQRGRFAQHFTFTFVRNPYDRLVSCYADKIAGGGKGLSEHDEELGLKQGLTFQEFSRLVSKIPDEEANPHYRSQYVSLCRESRVLPEFIGHFENLVEDFSLVARKIGAPGLTLPHRLRSEGRDSKHYSEFYDEKSRGLAEERFARDLELFGYSFQESQ